MSVADYPKFSIGSNVFIACPSLCDLTISFVGVSISQTSCVIDYEISAT